MEQHRKHLDIYQLQIDKVDGINLKNTQYILYHLYILDTF